MNLPLYLGKEACNNMSLPTMHIASGMSLPFLVWLIIFLKNKVVTAKNLRLLILAMLFFAFWSEVPDIPRYFSDGYKTLPFLEHHCKNFNVNFLNIFCFHGFLDKYQPEGGGLLEGLIMLIGMFLFILFVTQNTILKNAKMIAQLKGKILLRDSAILKDMVDIHCHILPKVDDGPSSIEESLDMCRKMVDLGFRQVIATPHLPWNGRYNIKKIEEAFAQLKDAIEREQIPLKIYLGAETKLTWDLSKQIKNKELPTLANSRYFFLELDNSNVPQGLEDFIKRCNNDGFYPIIPHPERNEVFLNDIEQLRKFKKMPVLLQMSASSLVTQDKKINKFARQLLKENMIDIIASDAHSINAHLDQFLLAISIALAILSKTEVQNMLNKLPQLVLSNSPIDDIRKK